MSAPSLRFTDNGMPYPDAISVPVSEIGILYGGLSGKSAPDFGHGLPFVTYKQVFDCAEVDLASCGQVSISSGERQNCIALGDVLFTSSSETPKEVGYASVVTTEPEETYLNSFCFGLRPKPTTLVPAYSRYLFHAQEYREQVETLAQGTTRYNISKRGFLKINLTIPSLPEQSRIADALSSVDNKIDLLTRKRDNLARFKAGLMQKIFSQEVRFTREDGSAYPDWEEKSLGQAFVERSERGYQDATLLAVTQNYGVVEAESLERGVSASADRSKYKRVVHGDIAYNSMRMWQGASGLSPMDGIVSPAYTVVIPKSNQNGTFWSYLFKYPPMVKDFERFSQGLTSDTWNLKFPAFSKVKVVAPGTEEQKRIADLLTAIDDRLNKAINQIANMQSFKKGLLQQMFV